MILCDIDGTLTYKPDGLVVDFTDVNPKPKDYVVNFINQIGRTEQVYFFTKRRKQYKDVTIELLKNIGIDVIYGLIMRPDDVYGIHTDKIKWEMFERMTIFKPFLYIEDHHPTIELFKKNGVNTIHPNRLRGFSDKGVEEAIFELNQMAYILSAEMPMG